MTKPSKARIRAAFERAAPTYDSAAAVQRAICDELLAGLPETLPAAARILDAGCGTGYALPLLQARYPNVRIVALDFSGAMLGCIATPCCRVVGDLEHLPLADASIDLVWSSLSVQWCDLPRALAEARRVLRPNGKLALATLGPETFHELRAAFADVDDYRHTLGFHAIDEIEHMAATAGFVTINRIHRPKTENHPDFKSLLRAVKAVGANQVGSGQRPGLMSRSTFQRAEAAYEGRRTTAGLPLTYDVITMHARKPVA